MTLARFDTVFEQFLESISITKEQADCIDEALSEAISIFMSSYEGDINIYAQGSYSTGTMVRPLTKSQSRNHTAGDYDIDIALERFSWKTPRESLQDVNNILLENYGERVDVDQHESCERVYHLTDKSTGVAFHADYVPTLEDGFGKHFAPKRSNDRWFSSNTKLLSKWFHEFVLDKPFLPALIIMIKRIRDYAGLTSALPSICILAILCQEGAYTDMGSYADDLLLALKTLASTFNQSHEKIYIPLPINKAENLAERLSKEDCALIASSFSECAEQLQTALDPETPNLVLAAKYLSDDFPIDMNAYPECLESLRYHGLGLILDGSLIYSDIEETEQAPKHLGKLKSKFFITGAHLKFRVPDFEHKCDDASGNKFGVRWQVLNSKGSEDRRGEIFEAHRIGGGPNANKFINYETELYNGTHWIRYFIYNRQSKLVIEIGRKFFVEVDSSVPNLEL